MHLRDATDADWPAVWPFLREIVTAGETYCWPRDTTEDAARTWWTAKPGGRAFVAVDDDGVSPSGGDVTSRDGGAVVGRVVGTAELHPNQPAAGSHVANAGFMVDPAHAGHGVGRALAEHVIAEARRQGYRAMQFNAVVETNAGAIRLWRSLGFAILATVPAAFDHPTHGPVGLHVMWRDLTAG